jgi:hypothetical protein
MKNAAKPTKMPKLHWGVNYRSIVNPRGLPDKDVALFFNHDKVCATALVLTHEGMRNEVQEHVGEETTSL